MSNPALVAEVRNEFGKGAARRARRAGKVPGVIYGSQGDPIHVDLPGHDLFLIVRDTKKALIDLTLDGKKLLVQVQEVQKHPVTRVLLHVDLLVKEA